MNKTTKDILLNLSFLIDLLISPCVFFSGIVLKLIRRFGINRLKLTKTVLYKIGIFPILDHYYEPLFRTDRLIYSNDKVRNLPGIDMNLNRQLDVLESFSYSDELSDIQLEPKKSDDEINSLNFYMNNRSFATGDAEYWYNLIRSRKPKQIIEIGSGLSTALAILAINKNKNEDENYSCKHICIEPYEMPWLEKANLEVIREKVENIELSFFHKLSESDILFIDSSHIIRPQGDILYEYLEILPSLNRGVIVHIHDIFIPYEYPEDWLKEKNLFWNEQYLLEAFLSNNNEWEIIGALNYLHKTQFDNLKRVATYLDTDRSPGSFYIRKIK